MAAISCSVTSARTRSTGLPVSVSNGTSAISAVRNAPVLVQTLFGAHRTPPIGRLTELDVERPIDDATPCGRRALDVDAGEHLLTPFVDGEHQIDMATGSSTVVVTVTRTSL